MRVWSFVCCTMREQDLHFWFQDMNELGEQYRQRGLYLFAGPVGGGKTTLMHELAKSLLGATGYVHRRSCRNQAGRHAPVQLNEAIGLTYENLIKLSLRHRRTS